MNLDRNLESRDWPDSTLRPALPHNSLFWLARFFSTWVLRFPFRKKDLTSPRPRPTLHYPPTPTPTPTLQFARILQLNHFHSPKFSPANPVPPSNFHHPPPPTHSILSFAPPLSSFKMADNDAQVRTDRFHRGEREQEFIQNTPRTAHTPHHPDQNVGASNSSRPPQPQRLMLIKYLHSMSTPSIQQMQVRPPLSQCSALP